MSWGLIGLVEPPVPAARLRGILSLLQHQSLPQRLKALSRLLESIVPPKEAAAACALALKLRTFETHGDHLDEMAVPMIPATVDMLASMCVLWDLTSCGMPAEASDRKLTAARRARCFGRELAMRKHRREQATGKMTRRTMVPEPRATTSSDRYSTARTGLANVQIWPDSSNCSCDDGRKSLFAFVRAAHLLRRARTCV